VLIERQYQTFWPRFWAGWVDGLVFLPIVVANVFAYGDEVPIWLRAVWYVATSFASSVYAVLMHARYGQTLGKMATDVKVFDILESRLSARQALMREIVPIVLIVAEVAFGLPGVFAGANPTRPPHPEVLGVEFWLSFSATSGWFIAELVTMLTNSKRRALHDLIARSVVVRVSRPALVESRDIA